MTETSRRGITDPRYEAKIKELAEIPRDGERFQLVITDKNQMRDEILAKLGRLKEAQEAAQTQNESGGAVRTAFIDLHEIDREIATKLAITCNRRTSRPS